MFLSFAVMTVGLLSPQRGTCTGHQLPQRLCRFLGPDMVGERRVTTGRFDDTVDYIRFV